MTAPDPRSDSGYAARPGPRLLGALLALLVSAAASAQDPRSQVLLEFDCHSEIGSREVTLFANGTLRLRERPAEGEATMRLADLDLGELEGFRERLLAEDLSEAESPPSGASGEWVEQCRLTLDPEPPHSSPLTYRFGRYDSLGLQLSRVVAIAEELAVVGRARHVQRAFPPGYRPRPGDVLLRFDGERFEVVRETAEGAGVEVRGFDSPLVLYLRVEDLSAEFVGLEGRQEELAPEER